MTPQDVDACTIFLMLAGSRAHGTSNAESDEDFRGVCIPKDLGYYFGFTKKFEQQTEWDGEDKVVYDLRKAMRLMTDGNPNMVEFLWVRDEEIVRCEPAWEAIREQRDLFLSKKMRHTFSGYAFSQLKRIKRHRRWVVSPPEAAPTRKDFGLPEKRLISTDQLNAFQWMLAQFMEESVEWFKLSPETREELKAINFIGPVQSALPEGVLPIISDALNVSDNFLRVIAQEKDYHAAKREWQSYETWKKERNRKRYEKEQKYGYDPKHAAHLVRLMRMGLEILQTGTVEVFRSDREELVAIKDGAWTYDELEAYADEMEQKIAKAEQTSSLPKSPDRAAIDALCQSVISNYL